MAVSKTDFSQHHTAEKRSLIKINIHYHYAKSATVHC